MIWDTIGGSVSQMLFNHIAKKGRMVIIGATTGYNTPEGANDEVIHILKAKVCHIF